MTCHSGGTLEVYVEPYLPGRFWCSWATAPWSTRWMSLARAVDYATVILPAEALPDGHRSHPHAPGLGRGDARRIG